MFFLARTIRRTTASVESVWTTPSRFPTDNHGRFQEPPSRNRTTAYGENSSSMADEKPISSQSLLKTKVNSEI